MTDQEVRAWHRETLGQALVGKMKKRGFNALYAQTAAEAKAAVLALLPAEGEIALLGSQTMNQIGVYAHLRQSGRELIDHAMKAKGLIPEEAWKYCRRAFTAAACLAGTNAVDVEGRLYNVDGNGNRVATMIYGPDKVILAVGMNKVVEDAEAAWRRIRDVASPQNTKRLGLATPCAKSGHCHDCPAGTSICNYRSVIEHSKPAGRINVVLIGEDLGY